MATENIPLFEEQYGYLMDKSMLEIFNARNFQVTLIMRLRILLLPQHKTLQDKTMIICLCYLKVNYGTF